MLWILDYGAGNTRSLANTITKLGFEYKFVQAPEDIEKADVRQSLQELPSLCAYLYFSLT